MKNSVEGERGTQGGATRPVEACYLFSHHVEPAKDGLHLAYSRDGWTWKALAGGRSLLEPAIGPERLMRDPHVFRSEDGVFHLVWTCGWSGKGVGYARSQDLIHWSPQRYLPVMEHEPGAINCWSPEIVYERAGGQYLMFWSTTIPGRFPETDHQSRQGPPAEGKNHRIYYVATRDFEAYSPARLLYDPGFNCIDACIVPDDGRYLMFLKDETNRPFVPQKNIKLAVADRAEGPYGPASAPITGAYWCEGPSAIRIGGEWFVYFDKFREHAYGAVVSKDLEHWQDVSDRVSFPKGVKHGTALAVPADVLEALRVLP
jgi:beta-xylosidase